MAFGLTRLFVQPLLLRSLKAIRKEATRVARILGRAAPNPGIGSPIQLSGRDTRGLLNLIGPGFIE